MRSTYEEQEGSKTENEQEWAGEVCIVHDVLVNMS